MDEPLSLETVNQLVGLFYQLPLEQVKAQGERMREEQPLLHAYLSNLHGHQDLDEEAFGYVVTLGLTLWVVLEQAGRPAGEVTEEILQHAIAVVDTGFKGASEASPEEGRARALMQVTGHPEPGLVTYLVLALSQKADGPLNRSAAAWGFYHLRVVLEALVASRKPKRRPRRQRMGRQQPGRA